MWNEGIGSSGELRTHDDRIKKRHSYRVPWGWKKLPENPNYISPVPKELQALETAIEYRDSGDYSWSELAGWLHKVTGRSISHMGFKHLYLKAKKEKENGTTPIEHIPQPTDPTSG